MEMSVKQTKSFAKFGIKDQLGYMFGDFANGLFFSLTASYLTLFYVDVLGISALSVGTLLVVARIWDAINDPMIGGWIDKQKPTPSGKFRPWILYMAVPVVIFGMLSFSSIETLISAPAHVKLMYAYFTYICFGMSYTAINIPYGSLASTMSDVEEERATLSVFRSYGGIGASFTLMILVPYIVFDANNVPQSAGFNKLVLILGVMAIISYVLCNKLTTERVIVERKQGEEAPKMTETLKRIAHNQPLIIQMIVGFIAILLFLAQGSLAPYLFKDYFQNARALAFNGFLQLIAVVIVSPFVKVLVRKYGKKALAVVGMIIYATGWTVFLLWPSPSIVVYFVCVGIATVGITLQTLLIWAFIPDCIDYQEYQTGIREEGTIYAIYSFARKLGQAGAGYLGAYSLILVGYVASATTQSPETLEKIKFYSSIIPIVGSLLIIVILQFGYKLDKETLDKITEELRAKR